MEVGLGLLIFLGAGVLAGFLAGLFGVGGGIVIVPVLALIFRLRGFSSDIGMHVAIGTSLAAMIGNICASVWAHQKTRSILWPLFRRMAPFIAGGTIGGVVAAYFIPGQYLHIIFGAIILGIAVQTGFNLRPKGEPQEAHLALMGSAGTLIGGGSALLGLGGGPFFVPLFNWVRIPMGNAVATSSISTLPVATIGAIGFAIIGWDRPGLPPFTTGYIYWPAFAGVVLGGIAFAPLGAKVSHKISPRILRWTFALFLAIVGLFMLFH